MKILWVAILGAAVLAVILVACTGDSNISDGIATAPRMEEESTTAMIRTPKYGSMRDVTATHEAMLETVITEHPGLHCFWDFDDDTVGDAVEDLMYLLEINDVDIDLNQEWENDWEFWHIDETTFGFEISRPRKFDRRVNKMTNEKVSGHGDTGTCEIEIISIAINE